MDPGSGRITSGSFIKALTADAGSSLLSELRAFGNTSCTKRFFSTSLLRV